MITSPVRGAPKVWPRPATARDMVFPASRGGLEGGNLARPDQPVSHRIAIPVPPELPVLPPGPNVLQLTDGDCVSHGLAEGTGRWRASDQEVQLCLNAVQATATLLDPHARIRCAVSTETATCHLNVLTAGRNNLFTIRRGLDGADRVLLEELTDLVAAHVITTRPRRKRPAGLADLVILVAQDGIYAPAVRQLRLLGIPTWLLVPGRAPAVSLRSASCAVSYISLGRGHGGSQAR